MAKKATVKIEKFKGEAAGVDADGNHPAAYERVRQLYEEQLVIVRRQLGYYREEERRLVELLDNYPLPGQLSYLEEEE